MPKDNIERAIKKATGGDAETYEEIRYEGYGPGGIALIVEALTDNRNRTAADVRSAFTKDGGNVGETGSVSFMFDRVGLSPIRREGRRRGRHDRGGDRGRRRTTSRLPKTDTRSSATSRCSPKSPRRWKRGSANRRTSRLVWSPQNTIAVNDEQGEKVIRLVEILEDHDDVQNVYSNFEVSDALMAKLAG